MYKPLTTSEHYFSLRFIISSETKFSSREKETVGLSVCSVPSGVTTMLTLCKFLEVVRVEEIYKR